MIESQITQYINENNLILIPILYIIGTYIKMTKINNKYIPWINLILSILLVLFTNGISFNSLLQGILISSVPTFVNQLYKQTIKKEDES